ncbi:MAG: signal peptidase II [Holosporales bacterium]|jgi:signal peptidase II|nr:signal peptidase II [Holosporales bacterium]
MTNLRKVHFFSIFIILFTVVFDQATKWSVLAFLERGEVVEICPYVNLVLHFNFGTSFGLLSPANSMQKNMIIALTIFCVLLLIYMFFKLRSPTEKALCGFLIGGAIGNLIDRFIHGGVIDFIDVYYASWHWPAFNAADFFISSSAVLLLLCNLFSKKIR